jgi:hypothetical protein
MTEELLTKALELFTLTQPYTREQLDQKREELLHTWTPRRFANLTNNPKKYMQAYTESRRDDPARSNRRMPCSLRRR